MQQFLHLQTPFLFVCIHSPFYGCSFLFCQAFFLPVSGRFYKDAKVGESEDENNALTFDRSGDKREGGEEDVEKVYERRAEISGEWKKHKR
jgi:hypothetical protein